MNINAYFFSGKPAVFVEESLLSSLTIQQKKSIAIASIAIGFLTIFYLMTVCLCKSRKHSPLPPVSPHFTRRDGVRGTDGLLHYPDGATGQGQIRADQLLGFGTIDHRDGTHENGQFNGDLRYGTILRPNGVKEQGHFKNDHLHGEGRRTYPNGTIELGIFKHGQLKQQMNLVFETPFP